MKFTVTLALLLAIGMGQFATAEECKSSSFDLINITGTVVRQEKETLDKTGEIKTVVAYHLDASGREIALPADRHCNGELKVDLESLIGKKVTLAARGKQKRSSDGEMLTRVHQIVSVFQPISLRGKLVMRQREELDDSGDIKTVEHFRLETADADIDLPASSELRSLAGQAVSIKAIGIQKSNKDGKTLAYVHEVVSAGEATASVDSGINPFAVN